MLRLVRLPWLVVVFVVSLAAAPAAQLRLLDESDRAAFRAWFVFLADAQFYRTTPDVNDCAALVRHAYREALRAHTPEWARLAALPIARSFPDVRRPPKTAPASWPLFRVSDSPRPTYAEFANARTIVQLNARRVGREIGALRPGDLLYFRQPEQTDPDHLMVYIGPSALEPGPRDWIVYHTGPSTRLSEQGDSLGAGPPLPDMAAAATSASSGEVRKVRLADLTRHPAPRWRPVAANARFVGIFRLSPLW